MLLGRYINDEVGSDSLGSSVAEEVVVVVVVVGGFDYCNDSPMVMMIT
jgi:hypothetical protein